MNEERWSGTPTLVLWMILDKLYTIQDRVYFASVCKHWSSAAQNYQIMIPQPCPWLMHPQHIPDTNLDLLNIFTKEKLTLCIPEFDLLDTEYLCSKRGWLLFIEHGIITVNERDRCHTQLHQSAFCFILVNARNNAKIKLPSIERNKERIVLASLSLSEYDYPKHVVLNTYDALYIASVEDGKWRRYSFEYDDECKEVIRNLVVSGNKVYCLTYCVKLYIFDMGNLSWKKVNFNLDNSIDNGPYKYCSMLESEGKIVMVGPARKSKAFVFFKLNDTITGWEEVHSNKNGNSFLFDNSNHHFSVKEMEGIKRVYQLYKCQDKVICNRQATGINIYNLTTGSTELYDPQSCEDAIWVDLGWMAKLPSSCVNYALGY